MVRLVKITNGSQRPRELGWLIRKRSVTVGELRSRVAYEMRHPVDQVRVFVPCFRIRGRLRVLSEVARMSPRARYFVAAQQYLKRQHGRQR